MAKKTKAAELSIEEKLEQALVVPGYEPYKIPDNWCWVKFRYLSKIQTGKKDANYGSENGIYPFFTCASLPIRCNGYSFDCNAIILAGNGDISNISIFKGKFEAYQRTYVVECQDPLNLKFIYFYFKYRWVDYNKDKMFGTAIPYIRLGNIQDFYVPVSPISEQHRIVERIESLFSKLDEAKEKAQEVIDSFETRKAAILHKAFNGELTAKWREENGVGIENWENRSINDICHSLKYGTSKKSKTQGSVIVIRMGNLQQGEIDWSDLAYTDDKEDIEKYRLYPGDVLFNRTNSAVLVGKTSIYRGEFPAIYAGYLIKLDYKHDEIIGDYLNYALNTPAAKEYCNNVKTDGVNQSNINAKKIGAFVIPVASINEQQVIVEIISSLLKKENESKQAAEVVIDQIDTMKKAILARAFRGELGTNDPGEESAVGLIKEILAEDNTEEKPQKARRTRVVIPKEIDSLLKTELERKIVKLFSKSASKEIDISEIMNVSSNKLDIINTIRALENKQLIKKSDSNKYILVG